MFNISGKKIVLSGATSGIGKSFALFLAENKCELILIAKNEMKASSLEKELIKFNTKFHFEMMDIKNPKPFHTDKVDMLINCAGIVPKSPLQEITDSSFNETMQTNVNSIIKLSNLLVNKMQNGSCIVNIISGMAYLTKENYGMYSISKAAAEHLTRFQALEFGKLGIRVNGISPGYISVERNAENYAKANKEIMFHNSIIKRPGTPNEILGALQFLISNASSYMTGSILNVDGGFAAKVI
ncbi:SDR family NAD(P)-dependent oxidoreductase [Fluviispira sanaruensis]|uniref:3-oxoacyl-ACP reductase n=1 Tax=Fluviispira sanaruensis TaxID=2493639 RepID=A0A4V0P2N7_FLUSA|nr:SDR family oxidoreductase [Fluviispira sanaruensis]BBH53867.1 3-oxoacyl-ACP reductase [Fluviispira sanaruensis]